MIPLLMLLVLSLLSGALIALLLQHYWVRLFQTAKRSPSHDFAPDAAERHRQAEMILTPLFYAAAAAFDAGLVLVNAKSYIFFLNTQAEELIGIDQQAASGQSIMALLRDYQADALVRDVLADGEARETTLNPVLSGRMLRLRCTPFSTSTHGRPEGAILLIRDVTQINMLERARRDLVANVSHELRTPLASLKLLIETLQSEPPAAVAQHMLMQAAQEIDVVTQLVDELHELSQIESGRVTLQLAPGNINSVVERSLERIRPQTARKHLNIYAYVPPDGPPVLMDDKRIGQVLLNLLHNAVKFTSSCGEICVRAQVIMISDENPRLGSIEQAMLRAQPEPGADPSMAESLAQVRPCEVDAPTVIELPGPHPVGLWMLVSISDTGIGIPATDLPRIFERFYKVDRSRNRNAGGTGLGLAIAKHLIEGHGGRLWANSIEGRGSTFYFTLPLG